MGSGKEIRTEESAGQESTWPFRGLQLLALVVELANIARGAEIIPTALWTALAIGATEALIIFAKNRPENRP